MAQSDNQFVSFFKRLQESNAIRVFDRQESFTVHGKDALFVADHVYKTSTVIKYHGSSSLETCSLNKLSLGSFFRDCLKLGLHIEMWEQQDREWICTKRYIHSDLTQSTIMAVRITDQVSVAFTDSTNHRILFVSEFTDDTLLSNLESLLVQNDVKECLISDDSLELEKLERILTRCQISFSMLPKSQFKTDNIQQDLETLLESDVTVLSRPELELTQAMGCLQCLIEYLSILKDETNHHGYTLQKANLQFMKLDAAAVLALNLKALPRDGNNKTMNLFGLLDQCKTQQGSRLLSQWIRQPLLDIRQIEHRLDLVNLFFQADAFRQALQSFPDLHRLGKRFLKKSANLQDVIRMYQMCTALPLLYGEIQGYDDEGAQLLRNTFALPLSKSINQLAKFVELVETTVDLEAADNHEYIVKTDFDPNLLAIKEKMTSVLNGIQPEAEKIAIKLQLEFGKKLKFEKNAIYGYHLRLSRNDAKKIQGDASYIELTTQKAGVLFTTTTIKRLSADYDDLQEEYQKYSKTIAADVIRITGSYFPAFEDLNYTLALLDVLVSFAHVSKHAPTPFVRPKVVQEGMLSPNMGGKSTFIRQIGVICLMAQIGCFVPCDSCQVPILDAILARVGAGDSQLKGISTFMAEMLETSSILKTATNNSLIIIDELGRGTSTSDGYGLARVKNYHVTALADEKAQNLTLLYKIAEGVCDQSFGIHVASLAKFPSSVIQMAKRKAETLESNPKRTQDLSGVRSYLDKFRQLNGNQLQEGLQDLLEH
ncbi:DNA mismatch repair protein MutS [Gorgonomyces haynaldii]|nr:DNA mismatch repair protein MutS [Gorgonomyces haynaldii]